MVRTVVLVLCCCVVSSGCDVPERDRLRVFAASSLTEAFEAMVEAFEARHPGCGVDLHCAGTPQLVTQIREGAPADLLASADRVQMEVVAELGALQDAPLVFTANRMVIVTAAGNPERIRGFVDLGREGLQVVLCGPDVPAGRYARRLLERAGVDLRSVSDEPSVKAVMGKLLLGEVDAGIVYATDARSAGAAVTALPLGAGPDVEVHYPLAVLTTGRAPAAARQFAEFVLSEPGQRILDRFGFTRP